MRKGSSKSISLHFRVFFKEKYFKATEITQTNSSEKISRKRESPDLQFILGLTFKLPPQLILIINYANFIQASQRKSVLSQTSAPDQATLSSHCALVSSVSTLEGSNSSRKNYKDCLPRFSCVIEIHKSGAHLTVSHRCHLIIVFEKTHILASFSLLDK